MKEKLDNLTATVDEDVPIDEEQDKFSDEIDVSEDDASSVEETSSNDETASIDEASTEETENEESDEDKCDDIEAQIDKLRNELEVEKDKRLRSMAEFDNYRRRTNSNYTRITQETTERVILHLLPVLDDFDRMFQQDLSKTDEETIQHGFQMIHRKIKDRLESLDLSPIESEGKPFDVNVHEAISEIDNLEVEPGTIITEVEKGYRLKDKVIRHAKVIVGRLPEEDNCENDDEVSDE